jgi:Uma2 family endonuclease
MGISSPIKKFYSIEEYLAIEEETQHKHEFVFGEIFDMAGTTGLHNLLVLRLSSLLDNLIEAKNGKCLVFAENVKLELIKNQYYVYPDVMLICDERDNPNKSLMYYPSLIIEVLSNSTKDYDRGTKWAYYKTLRTLQYYMLVSQYEHSVEVYEKINDFKWIYTIYEGLEQEIGLDKLEITINTSQIYKNLKLWAELANDTTN